MKGQDTTLTLYGESLHFSAEEMNFNELKVHYTRRARLRVQEFMEAYDSYESWSGFSRRGVSLGYDLIRKELSLVHQGLIQEGYYEISMEELEDTYHEYILEPWEKIENLVDEVDNYGKELRESAAAAREIRKASRGRVVGGGFGVSGAVKGIALAGSLNLASGAAHSLANSFGNAWTAARIRSDLDEVLERSDFRRAVRFSFRECVENMFLIDYTFHGEHCEPLGTQWRRAETLIANLPKIPREDQRKVLFQALQLNPYDKDAYAWMLDQYGDQNGELTEFAAVFGLESALNAFKSERLENYAEELYDEDADLEDTEDALEQIKEKREALNYHGEPEYYEELLSDQHEELLEEEKEREVESRTVNGTVYATAELAEKARANIAYATAVLEQMEQLSYTDLRREREKLEAMNRNPENCIQKELLKFIAYYGPLDEKQRTFQGTVYKSYEERQRAEKELSILMGEINPATVTTEQIQACRARIAEHTDFGSEVRAKASELVDGYEQIILGRQIDDYIRQKYGAVDTKHYTQENVQKVQEILDDVYHTFGPRVTSMLIVQLENVKIMSDHYQAVSQQKKASTTVSTSVALVTTAIWAIVGIVGILLNHFIIPWFVLRVFLFLAIIGIVGEKIKEGWEDVAETIEHNRSIDEAKKRLK